MRNLLLVGVGGFLGSIARYTLGGVVLHATGAARFPLGTLLVNASGCLAIGALTGLAEATSLLTPGARLFLFTGLLGGYTTFSAFALESYLLGREQSIAAAALNVGAQLALGLAAVIVGHRMVVAIAG